MQYEFYCATGMVTPSLYLVGGIWGYAGPVSNISKTDVLLLTGYHNKAAGDIKVTNVLILGISMKSIQLKMIITLALALILLVSVIAYAVPDEARESAAAGTSVPQETEEPISTEVPAGTSEAGATPDAELKTTQSTPEGTFFSEDNIPSKESIVISTVTDLQKIGQDEAYPLDGNYILANNIDGGGMAFAPIGSIDTPFSGTFDGSGHMVANLQIADGGLFANLSGTVHSLELKDISVKAADTAGVLAGTVSGSAEIADVFITGTITLSEEHPENVMAGGLAGVVENAAKIQNTQAYVEINEIQDMDKLVGALVGNNKAVPETYSGCTWSPSYTGQAFGLDSTVNKSEGAATIQSAPSYVTLMTGGKSQQVTADTENAAVRGLAFREWTTGGELFKLAGGQTETATVTSENEQGAGNLTAVYEKIWADQSKTQIYFPVPVIISENTGGEQPLEPVDPVFPTEIEQITEVKPLDGVFPTLIETDIRIIKNPVDTTGSAGEKVTFSVEAQGEALLYQWQVSADGGSTWTDIEGAAGREYTFAATPEDNGKQFRCAVSGK